MARQSEDLELSAAICVCLGKYPLRNDDQFNEVFGDRAEQMRVRVGTILTEAIKINVDWTGLTLSEGGQAVMAIMAERHPELSAEAVNALGRYYTYLVR